MPTPHLALVPTPLMRELQELVDPYAFSLAIAYLLSPDFTAAERHLDEILSEYCAEQKLDQEQIIERCAAYLREAGVR